MSVLPAPTPTASRSGLARARGIASDLLIATALIWALPLLLGAVVAVATLLAAAM